MSTLERFIERMYWKYEYELWRVPEKYRYLHEKKK